MRGTAYYEEPEYHAYLLSRERRDLFPPAGLLSQIKWEGVRELLDFGMGNGYYTPHFYKYVSADCNVWGAECQETLIDQVLQLKVKEGLERLIPFYLERTEHPLLPDWIPDMDMIFCACVLSTFADPALAIKGVGRAMKNEGRLILVDWEKTEAPSGPELQQKVSRDRMLFFVEDAGYRVVRQFKTNAYYYALELEKGEAAREERDRLARLEHGPQSY